MGKGIENRGSQVHHVKRGDLLAEEHAKEIGEALKACRKCGEKITDELRHISECKKFGVNVQAFFNELHESL